VYKKEKTKYLQIVKKFILLDNLKVTMNFPNEVPLMKKIQP